MDEVDFHQQEEDRFAAEIAEQLKTRALANEFEALVIATEADVPTPPCGVCRQVLMEFAPELLVRSVTRGGAESRWRMSELLPHAFTPTSLGRR